MINLRLNVKSTMKRSHLIIFFAIAIIGYGCGNKGLKYYNKGVKEFEKEEYSNAIEDFQQAIEHGAPHKNADFYLAESYRLSNRIHEAEPYYRKTIEEGSTDEHAHFYYGYAMKAAGNYEGAEKQFEKYIKNGTNFDYINRAKHELSNLRELKKFANKTTGFEVKNFHELNTDVIDYSPMFHGKDLYFTSSRGEGIIFSGQGTRFTDIYEYKFDGITPHSGQARKITEVVNLENTHEASATFSPDGKTMIFSRSNNGKYSDPTQVVDLFESNLVDGVWSEPKRLSFNERFSWDSSPCLSPDGQTLYFSSNRDGGFGANDLWKVERQADGSWGNLENLGPYINSDGEDVFPYIAPDGTLYFSSDGHVGFGELDLFVVKQQKGKKPEVINLGRPINSSHDDFAITFENELLGYFTSNRPGGKGDDDIYIFEIKIKYFLEVQVKGKVLDNNGNPTGEEVPLENATVSITDSTTGTPLGQLATDDQGWVRIEVQPEKLYSITASKTDYLTKSKTYSTVNKTASKDQMLTGDDIIFKTNIILDPKVKKAKIELAPIFYPYDKWNITSQAAKVLDELVTIMKDNPDIKIELGSHTDPRNTFKYNDLLSQRRAESAVDYILSKGIDTSRIYPKGYGERVPFTLPKDTMSLKAGQKLTHKFIKEIEDNELQELAYQLNRRTEFTIVDIVSEFDPESIEVIKKGETEEVVEDKKVKDEEINYNRLLNRKN